MTGRFDSGETLGRAAARRLAALQVCEIGPGLTDAEFVLLERDLAIEFADDHRAFLAAGLPFSSRPQISDEAAGIYYTWEWPWPDWRGADRGELRDRVRWPVRQALRDVEARNLWSRSWGERPASATQAVQVARQQLAGAPALIPVYGHRFLPGGQGKYGYPVLSIWQPDDVVIYGTDLHDYIGNEFDRGQLPNIVSELPAIPFWTEHL